MAETWCTFHIIMLKDRFSRDELEAHLFIGLQSNKQHFFIIDNSETLEQFCHRTEWPEYIRFWF